MIDYKMLQLIQLVPKSNMKPYSKVETENIESKFISCYHNTQIMIKYSHKQSHLSNEMTVTKNHIETGNCRLLNKIKAASKRKRVGQIKPLPQS